MENINETVKESAAASPTAAAEGTAAQQEAAAPPAGQGAAAGGTGEAKIYDQAYIDKLLSDQKAAQEAAVAEALKVAGMDESGKVAYEKEQAQKRLEQREAEIALRELKADAREVLSAKEVPEEFLDMLVGKDLEETKANADAFKKQFDVAVQAQVEKRLAGKTPPAGSGAGTPSEAEAMAAEIAKYMV